LTERLYYKEPGLLEFEARIVESGTRDDRFYTILDRSAFYPTSGGQLYDTGKLGDVDIVEVLESESGEVQHLSLEPVGEPGQTVGGSVDKERRQRHRRQHTAQHILSAVFAKLYDLDTMSVHLGEEYGAIEFNTDSLTVEQLTLAEELANTTVLDGLPIDILFLDREEIASVPLRKPSSRTGTLRIIRIRGCDHVACGGTHCTSTAEVGLIKITAAEKARGRILVKFFSGRQAIEDYAARFLVTDYLSRTLTCAVSNLPEKFDKIAAEIKSLKRQVSEAQKQLLPVKAAEISKKVQVHGQLKYIAEVVPDVDLAVMPKLAGMAADIIEGLAVLHSGERLVLAVCEKTGLHAGDMARALAQDKGLKGGGNKRQAQLGGVQSGRLEEYVDSLLNAI